MQASGAQTLSDVIVQEVREPRAIDFQGFQRAQHDGGLGHLVGHASGKSDFALRQMDGEHGDGKGRSAFAEAAGGGQRLALEDALQAADPQRARRRHGQIGEVQALQLRGCGAEHAHSVAIDGMECPRAVEQPGAAGTLAEQHLAQRGGG